MFLSLTRRVLLFLSVVCLISFSLIMVHTLHEEGSLSWIMGVGAGTAIVVLVLAWIAIIMTDDYLIPPHTALFFICTAILAGLIAAVPLTYFLLSDDYPQTYLLYFGLIPAGMAAGYAGLAVLKMREAYGLPPEYRPETNLFLYSVLPLSLSIPALLVSGGLLALAIKDLAFESRFDPSMRDSSTDIESDIIRQRRGEVLFQQAKEAQQENHYRRQFDLFRQAADLGHPEADYEMALIYSGDGYLRNLTLAIEHFDKATGYEHQEAAFRLGRIYRRGDFGVEVDFAKAREYLTVAANGGHLEAQVQLGYIYNRGEGVEVDQEAAFYWFLQAAKQGDATAQNDVGIFYLNGTGVEADPDEAVRWIGLAADQGVTVGEYNLGRALFSGELVPQDYQRAYVYFKRLAEKEIPYGYRMIGLQNLEGLGVEQDFEAALKAFSEGAKRGDAPCMYHLATCYLDGLGTEVDSTTGLFYLELAVERGHGDAQFRLGQLFLEGDIILQDRAGAAHLFRIAAAQGVVEAEEAFESISATLTPAERADANERFVTYQRQASQ